MTDKASNLPEFSVSDLSFSLKRTIEEAYPYVRVRGEISGYRGPHSSGHAYFALKDDRARLEAVVWKTTFSRLRFKPEEGIEVVATGKITTFPGSSKYQIVIEALEPAGVGALMALLEERRKKLAAEGLFDETRKRPIPYLPTVIGVVTSPTGAVIRDILHRLSDRFPRRVLVWPVRVQGETSAEEVAAAIRGFNAFTGAGTPPRPDVLIVARGGGSLEDLWSFNEEAVVRATAESAIPVISAIGHETDWTLIDLAADLRAPTPTGAAEMAVPVRSELVGTLADLGARLTGAAGRRIEAARTGLRSAARALPSAETLFLPPRQRLDGASGNLGRALGLATLKARGRFERAGDRLAVRLLRQRSEVARERLDRLATRHAQGFSVYVNERSATVRGLDKLLGALSYRNVLKRGFALVRDGAGNPVRSVAAVAAGSALDIELADGHLAATAGSGLEQGDTRPAPSRRKRKSGGTSEAQASLFDD
ncbi:MAG: exodeoxyribonuclease VII large subunit [Hyphomicrobiales bacterium]